MDFKVSTITYVSCNNSLACLHLVIAANIRWFVCTQVTARKLPYIVNSFGEELIMKISKIYKAIKITERVKHTLAAPYTLSLLIKRANDLAMHKENQPTITSQ